jgi:hypothetical protein
MICQKTNKQAKCFIVPCIQRCFHPFFEKILSPIRGILVSDVTQKEENFSPNGASAMSYWVC